MKYQNVPSPAPPNFDDSEDSNAEMDRFVMEHLKRLAKTETSDMFLFEFECNPASDNIVNTGPQDWTLCGTDSSRRTLLKESTFVLVFAPGTQDLVSTTLLQARVYEALRSGKKNVVCHKAPFAGHWKNFRHILYLKLLKKCVKL